MEPIMVDLVISLKYSLNKYIGATLVEVKKISHSVLSSIKLVWLKITGLPLALPVHKGFKTNAISSRIYLATIC